MIRKPNNRMMKPRMSRALKKMVEKDNLPENAAVFYPEALRELAEQLGANDFYHVLHGVAMLLEYNAKPQ